MSNVLIIPDTHLPFTRRDFLEFCRHTAHKYKCDRVTHVGDIVDNHAISFHDHDPNGMSPDEELKAAQKELKRWVKAFPRVQCAIGNHDELGRRKMFTAGIPSQYLKSFREVFDLPASWRFAFEWRFDNWRLTHGTGSSGHDAAFKQAVSARISTAQGHIHTAAGVKYHASSKDILWGLQVGCGIDRKAYAYNYGRDFKDKPILGCGVVLDNGRVPVFEPMSL
jgi:predicted phosphodiesterase